MRKEPKEPKVRKVRKVRKARKVPKACREFRGRLGQREWPELRDRRGFKVCLA